MQNKHLFKINDFFEGYAAAVARQDTKYIASCYSVPCTFISDDSSLVYSTVAKLESLINHGKHFYAVHNIVEAIPDVKSKLALTSKITRVKVKWRYYNKHQKLVYSCDYLYIIKLNEDWKWQIEVAVPINEKEAIAHLKK